MIALVRLQDFPSLVLHRNKGPPSAAIPIFLTSTFTCIPARILRRLPPQKSTPLIKFFPLQRAPFRTRIANAHTHPIVDVSFFSISKNKTFVCRYLRTSLGVMLLYCAPSIRIIQFGTKFANGCVCVCVFILYCRCMFVCRYALHMYDKRGPRPL